MTGPASAIGVPIRRQLGNGAVVLVKRTTTTPAVTINASFRAGAVCDPPGKEGLAHFVSRTIDRGTSARTVDQLSDELDGRGVTLSVTINRHALSLVSTCLAEDFDAILRLLLEVSTSPTFPDEEVDTRRREIVTLIRQDDDTPGTVALERVMRLLYGEAHPYGRPPRGTVDSVHRLRRSDLADFVAARVVPSTLVLAIVGDVDPDRALALASSLLDSLPGGAAMPLLDPSIPRPAGRRDEFIAMPGKVQADIAVGFVAVARADPAYESYWLMNTILGQYALGGRLGARIRERQGMAYYVSSAFEAADVPGPLLIRAGVDPGNVGSVLTAVDEELRTFIAEGPSDRELREATQYMVGSLPRRLETNAGIASFLQTVEFFGLGLDYDRRMAGLLASVTRDAVQAAAARLDPDQATVVVAGPPEARP